MNFTEAIVLAVEKVKAWIQSGGVKWDHVSDKPFVKVGGDTLTWDGNTEGLVSAADMYYKVSDAVPTMDDLANGATFGMANDNGESGASEIPLDSISLIGDMLLCGEVLIATKDNITFEDIVFPKKGIYFGRNEGIYFSFLTIPGYTGFGQKEVIDPAFLPEHLQFGESVVEIVPETEVVGADLDGLLGVAMPELINAYESETMYVTFDGTEYVCTKKLMEETIALFGNGGFLGVTDDTGEPFLCVISPEFCALIVQDTEEHEVAISADSVIKLPSKYYDKASVFYCNIDSSDLYLYADVALTTKVTLKMLEAVADQAVVVRPSTSSIALPATYYPYQIGFDDETTGGVYVIRERTDRLVTQLYHVAEYTA